MTLSWDSCCYGCPKWDNGPGESYHSSWVSHFLPQLSKICAIWWWSTSETCLRSGTSPNRRKFTLGCPRNGTSPNRTEIKLEYLGDSGSWVSHFWDMSQKWDIDSGLLSQKWDLYHYSCSESDVLVFFELEFILSAATSFSFLFIWCWPLLVLLLAVSSSSKLSFLLPFVELDWVNLGPGWVNSTPKILQSWYSASSVELGMSS